MKNLLKPFSSKVFSHLYLAQAISLLGDAFTWVGVALLAFQFGGNDSAKILAIALTLRVTAFIVFSPYAGVIADRINRKQILVITHFSRMMVVGLLFFVTEIWQLYSLIFLLNMLNAFFTPAYKASIPNSLKSKEDYGNAIVISNTTWQLLGMLGPGLAGAVAGFMGAREIFFFDACSFILAALIILTIPAIALSVNQTEIVKKQVSNSWKEIVTGTELLFRNSSIRFALIIEFITAIASANILVNTVGLIKGTLKLTDTHYGWIMTAFGVGATIAALTSNTFDRSKNKRFILIAGPALIGGSILTANFVSFPILLGFWVVAGIGQSYTYMPSQILIAENIELSEHGKAYGAHFAWSHLWFAITYPLAGLTGIYFANESYLIAGASTLLLLFVLLIYQFLIVEKNSEKI